MTSETVKVWQVKCIAENAMITTYSPTMPTLCPNDHPDRSIDPLFTIQVGEYKQDLITVQNSVPGVFQLKTFQINVPSGSPGDISTHDLSWPMDVYIWRTIFVPSASNVGDSLYVTIDPDRIIGDLTASAAIGDTELIVSSTVFTFPYLVKGVLCKLTDPLNPGNINIPSRIIGFDKDSFKIKLEHPLTAPLGLGTFVIVNMVLVDTLLISQTIYPYITGAKGFSANRIPPNAIMRFFYTNGDGSAKTLNIDFEYNYQ